MSDFILARVSQTLATEQSLETLVRQLLEMLEAVTRMESTYLTRIDINAQRQQIMFAHNSSEMQIPEGFSVPWDESLCKRALEDQCTFSNDSATKVPTPCNLTSRPSSVSSRSARLMVIRLKPNWATSSASDGIRSCGRQTPLWIFSLIACFTFS